jgi:hypothetical protein
MKPVAWIVIDGDKQWLTEEIEPHEKEHSIPLYIAPKELSDEEIMQTLNGIEYSAAEVETSFDYEIRIARAILKKASEK